MRKTDRRISLGIWVVMMRDVFKLRYRVIGKILGVEESGLRVLYYNQVHPDRYKLRKHKWYEKNKPSVMKRQREWKRARKKQREEECKKVPELISS